MMLTYSFTFNQDTREIVFAGNISSQQALAILQQIVIQEAVKANEQVKADSQAKKKAKKG